MISISFFAIIEIIYLFKLNAALLVISSLRSRMLSVSSVLSRMVANQSNTSRMMCFLNYLPSRGEESCLHVPKLLVASSTNTARERIFLIMFRNFIRTIPIFIIWSLIWTNFSHWEIKQKEGHVPCVVNKLQAELHKWSIISRVLLVDLLNL